MTHTKTKTTEPADATPTEDGRRKRADLSRARIVEALLDFAREGEIAPGADAVAERAGVGRRTVFRHFSDMEGLYREVHVAMLGKIAHIRSMPIEGDTWRERLSKLMERRAKLFEEILPIKIASDVHRFRSEFLAQEHESMTAMLRQMLLFVLPRQVKQDSELVEALDMALSIETWRRLRREQALSARSAQRTVRRMVGTLLAGVGD